jgi:uncharacterized protein (DUF58 family)
LPSTSHHYLDPKALERITRLDLRARLVVEGFITGLHKSPYHGFAVEFATHREYVPGDDVRHIDWKVWARNDRFYIKEFEEETNLACTVLLDASKSMAYGQPNGIGVHAHGDHKHALGKFDYAATLAACLAYLLQHQQDAVGLVTYDTEVRRQLPASSHPNHLRLLVHALEQTQPDHKTDVGDVFRRLADQVRKRGIIALVSDLFVDLETLADSLRQFRHRRHEVIVFHVMHHDELTFPFQDNTLFKGLEIDRQLLTEPRALRRSYLEAVDRFLHRVRKLCAQSGIDYVPLNTSEPLDAALARYLAFRQRTMMTVNRR